MKYGERHFENERYLYKSPMKFLSTFFAKHDFKVVSSLIGMRNAAHSANSGWGISKRQFFIFRGETAPAGLAIEE